MEIGTGQHGEEIPESGKAGRIWKTRRGIPWLYGLAIILAMGAGLHFFATPKPAPAASSRAPSGRQVSPVVVREVTIGDMPVRLSALGTVTARNTATVRVQVTGRLQQVLFHEGQMVKAGQVLARIDPRSFQTQVDSAAAGLAKDQAQLGAAQIDLKRYQTLLAQNSIASQQVDTQAALVGQLVASVASDRAALAQAQLQLGYAQVTAPIGGRAGLRQVDVGNVVQPSDTSGLVVITEVHPISVVFPLPQQQLQAVLARQKEGSAIEVEAWDADNRKQLGVGKLISIDNLIDPTTGTVKLKAEFGNDDDMLFPNQFVNVRLTVDTLRNTTLVPVAAVQPGARGSFVFVVDGNNKVSMRSVQTGPNDGVRVAVLDGLRLGERVVTDGVDRVRDGAIVQVMSQPETPSAAAGGSRSGRRRGNGPRQSAPQGSAK
jgi:multidrug efflux system membrane fusion protein